MPRIAKAVKSTSIDNSALLAAALEGLQLQKRRLEDQIAEVRARLGTRRGRPPGPAAAAGAKRRLSAGARKRIAAAQKKRWAEYRKKNAAAK